MRWIPRTSHECRVTGDNQLSIALSPSMADLRRDMQKSGSIVSPRKPQGEGNESFLEHALNLII